jgi:iron complex outermembrane recepter protein
MKLRLLSLMAVLCLSAFTLQAQTTAKINGNVKDATGKPVVAATVTLYTAADSFFVKAEITDANGAFSFEQLKAGTYFLSATAAGLQKMNSAVLQLKDGESLAVPTLQLQPGGTELKGVVVKGSYKKPMIEVKADKTVFNVESSINATGSNAMELLQKSPGVVVDKDDNISMKGKNGVRIYVDGRPTQLDNKDLAAYLRAINSADIESIEMISNPSAKYDASGNAGIINIRLKKNKKYGLNGNIATGLNFGITPKTNNSLSLNYRNKKVNLFGNYSNNWGDNENDINLYRLQLDTVYDQKGINVNGGWGHNFKAGIDVYANAKNTFGFIVTGNVTDGVNTSSSVAPIRFVNSKEATQVLFATNNIPTNTTNMNYNFNYRYADTTGQEFNFDADYGSFSGRNSSFQPNYYRVPNTGALLFERIYRNNTPTDIKIYTAKFDYERPWKKGKLGLGAKYSNVKTDNTFDFFDVYSGISVKNMDRSNRFVYEENVNAAYVNYNRQVNARWSVQGGLRVENTQSEGNLESATTQSDKKVKRNYTDFFPSAAITFNASQKHAFNLTYSRRIDRPGYQDLNPFENKLDELTYQKGNAFLKPQYTNSIELTHTFKYQFNTTFGYSRIKDFSSQIIDTADRTRAFITQKNLASQDIYSINLAIPYEIAKWWNIFLNVNAFHSRYKAKFDDGKTINLSVNSLSLYGQQSFTIAKGLTGEISGWYSAPSIWGGTFKSSAMGGIDMGVQKQVLKSQGTVKISVTDIMRTMRWRGISDFGGSYIDARGGWESRQLRFNFSYRFGNKQVKAARQRNRGNEAESKRIKSGTGGFSN